MLATTIRHGDLVIEYGEDGNVRIVRQSNATHVELSQSEWVFLLKTAELAGWPIAPPNSATVG